MSDSEIDDFRILLDCDTGLADYPITTSVRQFVLINSGNTVARANQPALQAELMRTLAERTTSMTDLGVAGLRPRGSRPTHKKGLTS